MEYRSVLQAGKGLLEVLLTFIQVLDKATKVDIQVTSTSMSGQAV
jgi:hypothetical protein